MSEITTITITKQIHSKLIELGKKTETFDDIINKLLQENATRN